VKDVNNEGMPDRGFGKYLQIGEKGKILLIVETNRI
jgi:hypothetical protein